MNSINVKLKQLDKPNCSRGSICDPSLREGIKVLVVGLPQTGKTLLLGLLKEKLIEIGVPEVNIQIDSLDGPFKSQQQKLNLLLKEDHIKEELSKIKYSLYEVQQKYQTCKQFR